MNTIVKALFAQTLQVCEEVFAALEAAVPPPTPVPQREGFVFRCTEKQLDQAIIQKLSRIISGLHATRALLANGLYQEVGILCRVLDELSEDVIFLCQPLRDGTVSALHQEYLATFYQEDFDDPASLLASRQSRSTVSRRRIHAALAAIPDSPINQSDAQELRRAIGQAYSGYVHAASTHIMDSYGGDPPRYHINGMLNTPRQAEYEKQSLQYLYRSFSTIAYAAVCFKNQESAQKLLEFREYFERQTGMTNWPNPDQFVRNLRRGET